MVVYCMYVCVIDICKVLYVFDVNICMFKWWRILEGMVLIFYELVDFNMFII